MGDQQPVQVPLRQQRNNESLQIINTRGGALSGSVTSSKSRFPSCLRWSTKWIE